MHRLNQEIILKRSLCYVSHGRNTKAISNKWDKTIISKKAIHLSCKLEMALISLSTVSILFLWFMYIIPKAMLPCKTTANEQYYKLQIVIVVEICSSLLGYAIWGERQNDSNSVMLDHWIPLVGWIITGECCYRRHKNGFYLYKYLSTVMPIGSSFIVWFHRPIQPHSHWWSPFTFSPVVVWCDIIILKCTTNFILSIYTVFWTSLLTSQFCSSLATLLHWNVFALNVFDNLVDTLYFGSVWRMPKNGAYLTSDFSDYNYL